MFSSRSHQNPYPVQHEFVVQFKANTALNAEDLAGRVEHVVSGQATQFQSVTVLIEFVTQVLQSVQEPDDEWPLSDI